MCSLLLVTSFIRLLVTMADPILQVVVRSREGLLFEGPAWAVSSTNKIGPFDILALHANFVCEFEHFLIIHLPTGEDRKLDVVRGILKVKDNKVEAYMGV